MHFYENDFVSLYLSDLKKIEELNSPKQKLTMYIHPQLGYVFTINDEIQHIEKYQTLYHDMLVHLPMSFICKPQDALIIGGGSLFAAYEILKYPTIKTLTLCDHDHNVLEFMTKYYPLTNAVSATVQYGDLEEIQKVAGVKDVYVFPEYQLQDTATPNTMTGDGSLSLSLSLSFFFFFFF